MMLDAYRTNHPDDVAAFLTEQARREHIHHDLLARQLSIQTHTGAPAWALESTARELHDSEVVERFLATLLREVAST